MLTQTKSGRALPTLIWAVVGVAVPAATEAQTDAARSIPMGLELTLESTNIVVGEALILGVRISNPNPFKMFLQGVRFGDIEPTLEIQVGDGPFRRAIRSSEDVVGGPPIEFGPGAHIEFRRFLDAYSLVDHWPQEPGSYRLRLTSSVNALNPENLSEPWRVDWTSNEVDLTVTEPTRLDRLAMDFLRQNASFGPSEGEVPDPVLRNVLRSLSRINVYREFLESFGDSAYAPEIQWTLAKALTEILQGGQNRRQLSADQLADLQDAFAVSVTSCLDRGSIYADEFLGGYDDRGINNVMECAFMNGQWGLLERMFTDLALRHPDDQPAILFRHALLQAYTGKEKEARTTLAKLRSDFPKSEYVERAERQLARASRKTGGE